MWVLALLLASCTHVEVLEPYEGPVLPAPDQLIVREFSYDANRVRLVPKVVQGSHASSARDQESQKLQVAHAVSRVFAERLVEELQAMDLPAELGSERASRSGNVYAVEGEFLSIDLGNLETRAETGFGRTEVTTRIQLYLVDNGRKRLIETFEVVATGAGGRTIGTNVEADAARAAREFAQELQEFFARYGWEST